MVKALENSLGFHSETVLGSVKVIQKVTESGK